jgi:hypothetical protein
MKSDDEVRNMAGHPDVIPAPYREHFLRGYRAKENELYCQSCPLAKSLIVQNLNDYCQPKEPARHCPNCGKLCWESELNYSSTIKTMFGASTLYGVCKECADLHHSQEMKHQ